MKLSRLNDLFKNGKAVPGRWRLTPDHEIRYESENNDEQFGFKGALIAAEPEALVISVTEKQSDQKIVSSLVKLRGAWRADAANRLIFEAERRSGKSDVLTFRSGWTVGEKNELVYAWQKEGLRGRSRKTQELTLAGHWDISAKNRLVYRLAGDSSAALSFRGAFQSKSVLAKKGEIRYQLGSEVSRGARSRAVVLFGKWKISRDLALEFEMSCRDGRRSLVFSGDYDMAGGRRITVNLKTRSGEPLGIELVLTREFFGGDGALFLRLRRSLEESSAEAGVSARW